MLDRVILMPKNALRLWHSGCVYHILKLLMVAQSKLISKNSGNLMKALDIAGYIVELANKTPEHDLTNLKIQKLLYYAQGKYLVQTGDPLFYEKVEAWQYGPVVPEVYHQFKQCGSFPVTEFDLESYQSGDMPDEIKRFLQELWEKIGMKYSGSFLVKKTHAPGTPWSQYYRQSESGIEIPQESLKLYFATNNL